MAQTEIQKRTGLGKRTVRRLMSDHREAMEEERLKASLRAAEAAELARNIVVQRLRMMDPSQAKNEEDRAERVELLKKVNVRDLSVTYGVMTDKSEKLADQPQLRMPTVNPKKMQPRVALIRRRIQVMASRISHSWP